MLISNKKNLFAESVQPIQSEVVLSSAKSMVKITLSLNASFAVQFLSGFVGETLISVNPAIKNNVVVTMFLARSRMNSHSALEKLSVH
jgi:hypothetical protein